MRRFGRSRHADNNVIISGPQSRKASEPDKDKKGLEARADSIGSGRAIPIKQVRLPVCPPQPPPPRACVFDASALINREITHLTSIRARGSPGSSNQIIRRRRGKGFHCHSLRRSLLLPLHASLFPFKAASCPRFFLLPALFEGRAGSGVLKE